MQAKSDRTAILLVGGLIALLVCCLVLTVVGGLGAVWAWVQTSSDITEGAHSNTPMPLPTPLTQGGETVTVPPEAEAMRQVLAEALVPIADPLSLAERLSGIVNPPSVVADSAAPIAVGTEKTFWASDVDTNENFQLQARLAYATPHVYFWVDRGVSVDEDEVRAIVDTFEEESYPTVREFFGSEWSPGVDGDVHLYILYARGLGSSVAGYFSSKDELAPVVHEFSNGHEMFYLNADTMGLSGAFADGVLAHEFQHMIHSYRDRNEESWMNEGFSEVATFLNGYDLGGSDFAYSTDPDLTLTYWPSPPDSAHYGQAFLFLVYFLDRFGREATQSLVADVANGLDSIDSVLAAIEATDPATGEPIGADEVYRDWAVAMLLQDPSVAQGQYAFESYSDAPSVRVNERIDSCPTERSGGQVSQYGVDYIELDCLGDFTLTFQGAARVGIVPAEAYSGDYSFWSNRGDESDMTLTRAFDLRSVAAPIEFTYQTWYDLEEDYDYVYVEVSTDAGETWDILTTPSGTSEDPSGNSYGWGYNGFSGGGLEAQWIEERIDLSEFAGQEVLLRFEYITDAAVNGEGLLLDDMHLEALDYAADFEQDEAGWTAEGFVRLYNLLPQTYRVVFVDRGAGEVTEIPLDDSQSGSLQVHLENGIQSGVLVVVATARHTWLSVPYQISLQP
ncbi:MAG: hypothetical protein WD040_01320 [Anaerolineales bacterium]